MSINGALSNAFSGLTAAKRYSEVVSSNIANALNENYAKREIVLSSQAQSEYGGVRVVGVTREVDPWVLSERRLSDARMGSAETTATYLGRLERLMPPPSEAGSLAAKVADFDASLVDAASNPSSETRLFAVVEQASQLVDQINGISDGIQDIRAEADKEISRQIEEMNELLQQIAKLNGRIVSSNTARADTNGMEDQRQMLIDNLAEKVPVRVVERDFGAVALMTTNGAVLLDSKAAEIGFEQTPIIKPDMNVDEGRLSMITVNGKEIDITRETHAFSGGNLGALLDVRDKSTVEAQASLDALTFDLIQRFEAEGLDATTAAGDAGLFTVDGEALPDPLDETDILGISDRIKVNDVVNPSQGGELWRIRDGLGAAEAGAVSNSSFLSAMHEALNTASPAADSALGSVSRSFSQHSTELSSQIASKLNFANAELGFAAAEHEELAQMEGRTQVDTDQELQKLLIIERTYEANARVMQSIEEMLDALLRI